MEWKRKQEICSDENIGVCVFIWRRIECKIMGKSKHKHGTSRSNNKYAEITQNAHPSQPSLIFRSSLKTYCSIWYSYFIRFGSVNALQFYTEEREAFGDIAFALCFTSRFYPGCICSLASGFVIRWGSKKNPFRHMQTYKLSVSLFSSLSQELKSSKVMQTATTITAAAAEAATTMTITRGKDNAYAIENCCWQQQSQAYKLFKKRSVKCPGSLSHSSVSEEAFSSKCTKYTLSHNHQTYTQRHSRVRTNWSYKKKRENLSSSAIVLSHIHSTCIVLCRIQLQAFNKNTP